MTTKASASSSTSLGRDAGSGRRASAFKAALAGALAVSSAAAPVLAQDRDPAQMQTLAELAFVIGQIHAVRQTCNGPRDQAWRVRMFDMLRAEAANGAMDRRLRDQFNTGYSAAQAQHPVCNDDSRSHAAAAARRGAALAEAAAR